MGFDGLVLGDHDEVECGGLGWGARASGIDGFMATESDFCVLIPRWEPLQEHQYTQNVGRISRVWSLWQVLCCFVGI